jgi:hypothetical protein
MGTMAVRTDDKEPAESCRQPPVHAPAGVPLPHRHPRSYLEEGSCLEQAGRSVAIIEGLRNPLRAYYASLIETKTLPGPNPAADLKFFVGKAKPRAQRDGAAAFFTTEEGPTLLRPATRSTPDGPRSC